MTHEHAWAPIGLDTHFPVVPNSKTKPRPVRKLICDCGQRAYQYVTSRVVYTWPADEAAWGTEADHEAAQARKSPLARARRP